MKKLFCIFIMFFLFGGINVYAEGTDIVDDAIEISGANDIAMPDDANVFMDENHISISEPSGTLAVTPKAVLAYMWKSFKDKLTEPIRLLGGLIAITILASIIEAMGDTMSSQSMTKIYNIISILICIGIIANPICSCIQNTTSTLIAGGNFMVSYVPVFSSITAAGGSITSAGSYNIIVLAVAEIFTQIAKIFLTPMLGLCLALAVVEAINPTISLSGLTNGIKKIATWGIGFLMTIFVGMLTIQSIVGTSADTVGIKATKFVVSNFVPVIGGAISDAYTTVRGSLGVLRSGVGSFGIIALILTVLPTIMSVLAIQLSVYIGGIISEIFGVKQINAFLKNVSSVLSIALSLLLCFSLMLIISTTIMMLIGMNINMN